MADNQDISKNNKFLKIYSSLSDTEKIEFKEFVSSSLNSNKRNYLKIIEDMERNRIKEINKISKTKKRTLWNRFSELTLLVEKFLILKSVDRNNIGSDILLLDELKRRGLNNIYEQNLKKMISGISKSPVSLNILNEIIYLNNRYTDHIHGNKRSDKFDIFYKDLYDIKFALFFLELLEHLIEIQNFRTDNFMNYNSEQEYIAGSLDFDYMISKIKNNTPQYFQLASYYLNIYRAYTNSGSEISQNYYAASKIFFKSLTGTSNGFRHKLFKNLVNYTIDLINKDIPGANEELFKLVNKKFSLEIFSDDIAEDLNAESFRNYVLLAVNLKKYRWLENFIVDVSLKYPDIISQENIYYARSILCFYTGKYQESIMILSKINSRNPYIYLDVSCYKLRTYFELEEIDECFNELRRITDYLKNERILSDYYIKYIKRFCNSLRILLKLKGNAKPNYITDIEFELSKGNFIGKKWIAEKLEEIKKKI